MLFSEMLNHKSIVFPLIPGNSGVRIMKKLYHNFLVNQRGFISSKQSSDVKLPKHTIYANGSNDFNSAIKELNIHQLANNKFHLFIHGFEINTISNAFDVTNKINELITYCEELKNINIYIGVNLNIIKGSSIKNHLKYDIAINKFLPKVKAECIAYLYRPLYYGIEEEFVGNEKLTYRRKPEHCLFCKKIGYNVQKELIGYHVVGNQFLKMKKESYYYLSGEII